MMANRPKLVVWAGLVLLMILQIHSANGISWPGARKSESGQIDTAKPTTPRGSLSQVLASGVRSPNPYEVALNELRQLESEPLCHRTAARLLVNNCEVLESKNEATVLTDSGRKIRDFVDSYAASLAICDLERGSFNIPRECAKFREPVLTQLPLLNSGQLHVSSAEIDNCLTGLGESDPAWNTWVNYRHKALRFCEAARADNEKAQQIFVFERLTKIMGQYTDGIDKQFEQRMNDLSARAQTAGDRIDEISPKVDNLQAMMKSVEDLFLSRLAQGAKETTDLVHSSTENAHNLQRMLGVMFKNILEGQAEVAATYERSLQVANQHAESAIGTAMAAVTLATESVVDLQDRFDRAQLQAMKLESKQNNLEEGMQRLVDISENLAARYDSHENHLQEARNITSKILDSLENVIVSADYLKNSASWKPSSSWWPYIWCPTASLMLGSYRLPPSGTRNLALIALGETAGFTVSFLQSHSPDFSVLWDVKFHPSQYVWGYMPLAPNNYSNTTI